MILTMDVGNTNIKTALFDDVEMKKYWRLSTSSTHTSDEYGFLLSGLLAHSIQSAGMWMMKEYSRFTICAAGKAFLWLAISL